MRRSVLQALLLLTTLAYGECLREFRIDYENDRFLKDGEDFRYVAGSMHYFRVVRASWRDRLRKMRAAGLNAVSTYVEWSQHEPSPGVHDFTGQQDVEHFIRLAAEEDLLVILRPGPYICAERDFGGLPPWLLTLNNKTNLRQTDADYQKHVQAWFTLLLTRLSPLLYGNGGPIILVQVENEYGSFDACDFAHTAWLRDLTLSLVDGKAELFTTDGAGEGYLKCGKIQDVFATVDFGPGTDVDQAFASQRIFQSHGPLVNSEFYPGWLTHWQEDWQEVETVSIVQTLEKMLAMNASVNFYVFAGGTNFDFTSGANYGRKYEPSVTSYDYDAPLTEAGDPTAKYHAIRKVISRYLPLPPGPGPLPADKGAYPPVPLAPLGPLLAPAMRQALGRDPVVSDRPLGFEEMGQSYGYVLYEARAEGRLGDPAVLEVGEVRDRAIVQVQGETLGVLSRASNINRIPVLIREGQTVQLLVENQGRNNYGSNSQLKDFKGLSGDVTLDGYPLVGWTMTGFPLDDVTWLHTAPVTNHTRLPAFFRADFTLPEGQPLDTFLDMTGFGKGVAFVNGHNLGRYWPTVGPIRTLYVPADWLRARPLTNHVVIFETEELPTEEQLQIRFVTQHYIDKRKIKRFMKTPTVVMV